MWRRDRQEYKELGTLGRGNFSKVLKVKCRIDGMEYAAKRSAQPLLSDADKKRWQQARHPPASPDHVAARI